VPIGGGKGSRKKVSLLGLEITASGKEMTEIIGGRGKDGGASVEKALY